MSQIYQIRKAIKDVLTADGLWADGEVLIRRRGNIWNDIAIATAASATGQCLVIGVAVGRADTAKNKRSKVTMTLTIPVTLFETPDVDPDTEGTGEKRWEDAVMLLQGDPLGRSSDVYSLDFEGFQEAEDDDYVVRQGTFKTQIILKPQTPQAP